MPLCRVQGDGGRGPPHPHVDHGVGGIGRRGRHEVAPPHTRALRVHADEQAVRPQAGRAVRGRGGAAQSEGRSQRGRRFPPVERGVGQTAVVLEHQPGARTPCSAPGAQCAGDHHAERDHEYGQPAGGRSRRHRSDRHRDPTRSRTRRSGGPAPVCALASSYHRIPRHLLDLRPPGTDVVFVDALAGADCSAPQPADRRLLRIRGIVGRRDPWSASPRRPLRAADLRRSGPPGAPGRRRSTGAFSCMPVAMLSAPPAGCAPRAAAAPEVRASARGTRDTGAKTGYNGSTCGWDERKTAMLGEA